MVAVFLAGVEFEVEDNYPVESFSASEGTFSALEQQILLSLEWV